jgi:hypothetical protein
MRHERIAARDGITEVDLAAVWPDTAQITPSLLPDLARSDGPRMGALSSPDMPASVGELIVISYGALIGALALVAAGTRQSNFMIVVAALFVVMFFSVPRIFLRVERNGGSRPSLAQFMANGTETWTGHNSGKEALVQILILPVSLTFAVLAMAVVAAIVV